MRKEKGERSVLRFCWCSRFWSCRWSVHDLTKDKRTACVCLILYLSTLSQQKYT